MPQEETKLRDGRIVRSESPLNLEMPFSTSGQLSYADEIVLRSNAFSNPGNRSQCVVVTRRGRSGKTIRH